MYVHQLRQVLDLAKLRDFQRVDLKFGHRPSPKRFLCTTVLQLFPQGDDISDACPGGDPDDSSCY